MGSSSLYYSINELSDTLHPGTPLGRYRRAKAPVGWGLLVYLNGMCILNILQVMLCEMCRVHMSTVEKTNIFELHIPE